MNKSDRKNHEKRLTCGWGLITLDCDNTDEMQTSSVTSYLSTNLLVSLLTNPITFEQRGETESLLYSLT